MKIQVRFHSESYAPREGSERSRKHQSKRLAEYLSRRLREEGIDVVHVDPGEYGCLSISFRAPFSLCMDCYHAEEEQGQWVCTINGASDFFQNLFKPVNPVPDVCYLQSVLQRILDEVPEMEGVEWSLDINKCDLPS